MGQPEWRAVLQYQSADFRGDSRKTAAGWRASAPTLFDRYTIRRQGYDYAGGMLAAGRNGAEYDAWPIHIGDGNQFGSDFVSINPNSKIPAMLDSSINPPTRQFESCSILFYLAEKLGAFLPIEHYKREEAISWLMCQVRSAPFVGGDFGQFYAYAPFKIEYEINRYAMKPSASFMSWIRGLAGPSMWRVMNIQLPTWPYIRGAAAS